MASVMAWSHGPLRDDLMTLTPVTAPSGCTVKLTAAAQRPTSEAQASDGGVTGTNRRSRG